MEDKEWLFKKEVYNPPKDKDGFINKTIMGFMGVLSMIKREKNYEDGILYKINPMVKLFSTLLLIIFLSLSRQSVYTYIISAFFLLCLATVQADVVKRILAISVTVPIFTLIILIPSMIMGNIHNSLMMVLKIAITLIAVNLLSNTTKWHDITKAFKIIRVPDIFIFVFDITIKYIYILGEFSLEMLYALKLKSVGKNNKKMTSITSIMGNLFFKSKNMGEDMYMAMECRGFTGEYVSYGKFKFTAIDAVYILIIAILIALFFIL
ncbi:energy-coupling factor transporter transmembrane component T family protein [Clostridium mediterraneense]|uniref:energy-coupling factor transporter transmembrane component T family protein n=1 Tax=Clostridium mediterraneense TaxID=1805472 RepID=UPI00082EEF00|nr:energy-coupling factor transporter transmembrane component T [Clostridium mediterraneense]